MISSILDEILLAKEKRASLQKKLITSYTMTLICFTLNIPGADKRSSKITKVHLKGLAELETELKSRHINIAYKKINDTAAGPEAFLCVDYDPMEIKRITVGLEEKNSVARLFDIDVFSSEGELLSRKDLGFAPRKCLLCNENAKVCARSRKHSIEDLTTLVDSMISSYL